MALPVFDTPMLKQFGDIKIDYQDAILFFRLGDFYEMFCDDALLASRELDLVLTGRGKDSNRVPMCGVPHHSAEQYMMRLVKKGYKVAVCEQVEDPAATKGLTKREVVNVLTPGTIVQESGLDQHDINYCVALGFDVKAGLFLCAFMDVSTGEFRLFSAYDQQHVLNVVEVFQPKEVLVQEGVSFELPDFVLQTVRSFSKVDRARQTLCSFFGLTSLSAFGIESYAPAFPAAAALVDYVSYTHRSELKHVTGLIGYRTQAFMAVDATTLRSLDVLVPTFDTVRQGSLFDILNHTRTSMGARLLKQRLRQPLLDPDEIVRRLDAVDVLKEDLLSREEIREVLKQVYDLERLVGRISAGTDNPKDCLALYQSLKGCLDLLPILEHFNQESLVSDRQKLTRLMSQGVQSMMNEIEEALSEDSPAHLKDGHVIRAGFNSDLDALNESFKSVRDWIYELEDRLKKDVGIKALKVRYNKVFGYYIEVPKMHQDKVPDYFARKQTLTNAERYITPELKEKEALLLNGEDRRIALEQRIYRELVTEWMTYAAPLQECAKIVSRLDVFQSLAHVAQKFGYVRPSFRSDEEGLLSISKGRHPVIEHVQKSVFIENDFYMDPQSRFMLITGPNMAGKSTVMRQIALLILMAQMGSFVPAQSMQLSIVDQLFSRIGAMDNLYQGQSTFMVEMLETSNILHNATARSFVILDEVGRGTSTYDGVSLAYSISKYIHDRIQCRTLFATHYHELTQLSQRCDALSNFYMKVNDIEGKIVFTYLLCAGCADRSYGVHVAQLAGLPQEVIDSANQLLMSLEATEKEFGSVNLAQQLSLF